MTTTAKASPTPGPWKVLPRAQVWYANYPIHHVADCSGPDAEANAALIVRMRNSWPDLLAAVEHALDHYDTGSVGQDTWEMLRAAVAKARREGGE